MTNIYIEISKLTDKFRTMAYGITTDENKINEAVQELMVYLVMTLVLSHQRTTHIQQL